MDRTNNDGGIIFSPPSRRRKSTRFSLRGARTRRNHWRKKFTGVEIFIPPSLSLPLPPPQLPFLLDHDRALCDRNLISPRRAQRDREYLLHGITGRIDASCTFQRQTSADARLTAAVKRIIYGLSLCLTRGKRACFVPFCPPSFSFLHPRN